MTDLLLSHGFFLSQDPKEQEVMRPYPPLGLLYLSSYLKRCGYEIEVFDSTFRTPGDFLERLRNSPPRAVGFYANILTRASVLHLIKFCSRLDLPVIVGGPDPANYAEHYLRAGASVVVIGEGERTLEELLRTGFPSTLCNEELSDLPGIAYLEEDRLVRTAPREHLKDLDLLPFPDREAIDLSRYLDCWRERHGRNAVSLITARGCPYTCKWCSHSVFGYSYRSRSPSNVADEIEEILRLYDPDSLWYADDVFTMNHRWIQQFARELEGRKIRIPFETITREDRLNQPIIETLGEMGCRKIWIGSESGSQRVLDAMSRRTNAERVRELTAQLQAAGIEAGMFIMLGYEGETLEDLEETARHIERACPDELLITVAYPIKGTPYFDDVSDRILAPQRWEDSSDRDLTVRGRRSHRFYQFATRWMASSHRLSRLEKEPGSRFSQRARAWASVQWGRLGMFRTRNERV